MRIAIGSDHAGFTLKQHISAQLIAAGHEIQDYGCDSPDSVDYPDIAGPLAEAVVGGRHQLGIVICSNGVGVSIAANKVRGARAALCSDTWSARRAREHTDCNILALGAYVVGSAIASEIVEAFINAEFEGGRHERRLSKLAAIEEPLLERDKVIRFTDRFMYLGEEWEDARKRGACRQEVIRAARAEKETGVAFSTCKQAIQERRTELGLRERKPPRRRQAAKPGLTR